MVHYRGFRLRAPYIASYTRVVSFNELRMVVGFIIPGLIKNGRTWMRKM